MFNMYSVLLTVTTPCLLLFNANAIPIRTTTVYDALQITPAPLATQSHPANLLTLSSELCQDNVRSVGCEPPARLTQKTEPAQQSKDQSSTSSILNVHSVSCELPVRHGKHCNMIAGECVCHQLDPEWPNIWRYPSYTIGRRAKDKSTSTSTPTDISAAGHHVDPAFPFIWRGPGVIEDKPTVTPTPIPTEAVSIELYYETEGSSMWLGPLSLITKLEGDLLSRLKGKPNPTATSTETSSIGHPVDPAWPNVLLPPTQGVPAITPTPTKLSSEEERRSLEVRAVAAAGAHHTNSPASTATPTGLSSEQERQILAAAAVKEVEALSSEEERRILGVVALEAAAAHQINSPASTSTPTELSSEEERKILGVMALEAGGVVALEAAGAHHTLSPRDNEEELRRCPHGQCTYPSPAQPGMVSKTDISHPTLSHRNEEAQPTAPQPSTMTTIHIPTPTTTTPPCDPLVSECPNPYYQRCDPTERECSLDNATTKEKPSPTPTPTLPAIPRFYPRPPQHEKSIHTSPEKLCGANDKECRKNWPLPPTKTRVEELDANMVIPSDLSAFTRPPICDQPPFLC